MSAPTITTTSTTAVISWSTNIPTSNGVDYGPTTTYGLTTPWVSGTTKTPSFTLTGLSAGTKYYIIIYSQDPTSGLVSLGMYTLTTQTGSSPTTITSVSVLCGSASLAPSGATTCAATVTGTGAFSSAVTWSASAGSITSAGSLTAPSTGTSFTVKATSQQDTTQSGVQTISIVSAAPQLSSPTIAPTSTTAAISWTTNVPTVSLVNYGVTNSYGQTATSTTTTTSPAFTLTGLTPATNYYVLISSQDPTDNMTSTASYSFTTLGGTPMGGSGAVEVIAGGPGYYGYSIATAYDTINGIFPIEPSASTSNIQVVFGNSYGTAETPGPLMSVTASIEYPQGTIWPLTFNGSMTGQITPGGILTSDASSVTIPAGKVAYVREHVVRDPSATTGILGNYNTGYIKGALLAPNTTTRTSGYYDGMELLTTRTVYDGTMTSGKGNLVSPNAKFTIDDVGQTVAVTGAGANGGVLNATIVQLNGLNTVLLSTAASTTVSAATTAVVPLDKTILASSYIANHGESGYAPIAYLGQTATPNKSVCILGDSIAEGTGANFTQGSWSVQALNPAGVNAGLATMVAVGIPFIQLSEGGETVANLMNTNALRFSQLSHCTYVLSELGSNDMGGYPITLETDWITLWKEESAPGPKVYQSTIIPRGTSTDNFLTLANQTPGTYTEADRVSLNTWLRDGAPISSSTGSPVAAGSPAATTNRAAYYNASGIMVTAASGPSPSSHPLTGVFEAADAIESSRNSGYTMVDPRNRSVSDAAMVAGSSTLTSASAKFSSADVGAYVSVTGAGSGVTTGGATITAYVSSSQVTLSAAASTTVKAAKATVGGSIGKYSVDGTHPDVAGHSTIGSAAALSVANWP